MWNDTALRDAFTINVAFFDGWFRLAATMNAIAATIAYSVARPRGR